VPAATIASTYFTSLCVSMWAEMREEWMECVTNYTVLRDSLDGIALTVYAISEDVHPRRTRMTVVSASSGKATKNVFCDVILNGRQCLE
jgi:hypothetical protein